MHLVKAIIWSSGPIPRPGGNNNASGGGGGGGAAGGNWDVSELCLELLFTVLLRNRDRISLLWSRIYEHFHVRPDHERSHLSHIYQTVHQYMTYVRPSVGHTFMRRTAVYL